MELDRLSRSLPSFLIESELSSETNLLVRGLNVDFPLRALVFLPGTVMLSVSESSRGLEVRGVVGWCCDDLEDECASEDVVDADF